MTDRRDRRPPILGVRQELSPAGSSILATVFTSSVIPQYLKTPELVLRGYLSGLREMKRTRPEVAFSGLQENIRTLGSLIAIETLSPKDGSTATKDSLIVLRDKLQEELNAW